MPHKKKGNAIDKTGRADLGQTKISVCLDWSYLSNI